MPALNNNQQQARLVPQGTTPGNYYNQTGTKQPTSKTVAASGGTANPIAGFWQWLTGVWTGFTNIFNAFGVFGGWFSSPVRVLKMVMGIVLVGLGIGLMVMTPEIKALPGQVRTAAKTAVKAAIAA